MTQRVQLVAPGAGLVRAAVEAGLETWAVWDQRLRPPGFRSAVGLPPERLVSADFGDVPGLRAVLADTAREHRIDHTFYLDGEVAGKAADNVRNAVGGLSPAPEESAPPLPDKVSLRRVLDRNGVSTVHSVQARSAAEAYELAEAFPPPLVIRSTDGAGGARSSVVRDRSGLDQWAQEAAAEPSSGAYLLEELPTGPRFRVRTLTVQGMHLVADVSAGTAAEPLSAPVLAGIRAVVRDVLDMAGHESGVAHTEVVLTPKGARVAEVW